MVFDPTGLCCDIAILAKQSDHAVLSVSLCSLSKACTATTNSVTVYVIVKCTLKHNLHCISYGCVQVCLTVPSHIEVFFVFLFAGMFQRKLGISQVTAQKSK